MISLNLQILCRRQDLRIEAKICLRYQGDGVFVGLLEDRQGDLHVRLHVWSKNYATRFGELRVCDRSGRLPALLILTRLALDIETSTAIVCR
jgi:hypothetical protein